jgi:hypothetical protein
MYFTYIALFITLLSTSVFGKPPHATKLNQYATMDDWLFFLTFLILIVTYEYLVNTIGTLSVMLLQE